MIMFLLVKYQRVLEMKYAGYVTLVAGLALAAGALSTAVNNDYPYDFKVSDLWGRVFVVVAWIVIQVVFLCIGFVTKVVFPCAFLHPFLALLVPGFWCRCSPAH